MQSRLLKVRLILLRADGAWLHGMFGERGATGVNEVVIVCAVGGNVERHAIFARNAMFLGALHVVGEVSALVQERLGVKLRAHLGNSIEVGVEAIVLVAGERPESWRVHRSEVQEDARHVGHEFEGLGSPHDEFGLLFCGDWQRLHVTDVPRLGADWVG